MQCDLTNEKSVIKMFSDVIKMHGPIDILIANAGIYESVSTPIHEMKLSQWEKTHASNMTSVFLSHPCLFAFICG